MKRFHVIEIQIKEDASPIKKKLLSTDWLHKALLYSADKASQFNLQEDLFTKKTHDAEMGWSNRFTSDTGSPTHILIIKRVKKKEEDHTHAIFISEAKLLRFKHFPKNLT